MRDVAARASVDVSTVSRVLNGGSSRVSVQTRERIERAVDELNYRPNPIARSLRTQRSGNVGLLVPNIVDPVFSRIVAGAQRRTEEIGMSLVLAPAFDSSGAIRGFGALLRQGHTDALLIAVAKLNDTAVRELEAADLPVVLVNRQSNARLPHVVAADEAAARLATRRLITLGHRRIVHLAGDADADTALRRAAGFRSAIDEAGLSSEAQVVECGYGDDEGHGVTLHLLRQGERPTALVCASARAAIGALAAARELGVQVPAALSVIGINDIAFTPYTYPPLTIVDLPLEEMGYRGMDAVSQLLEGKRVNSLAIVGPPRLVGRESCGPAPDAIAERGDVYDRSRSRPALS